MFDFTRILIRKNKTGSGLKKTRVRLKKNRVRFKKTGSGLKKPGPVKKKHESGSTNRPVTLRINKRIPLVNLLLAPGPLFMIRPKLDSDEKKPNFLRGSASDPVLPHSDSRIRIENLLLPKSDTIFFKDPRPNYSV